MATSNRRSTEIVSSLATVLLVAGAVVLLNGKAITMLTGKGPPPVLRAPDEVSATTHIDPMPFLIARDTIEVRVDAPMTARQFLDLNRLHRPNLRRQVLEQLGNPAMTTTIDAGTKLRLQLTPRADDVPATSTREGTR